MPPEHLPDPIRLRILFFDIETAPMLTHIWAPKQRWVGSDMVLSEPFMLTWAAKWWGQKSVKSARLTSDEAINQDDSRIVASLADLIRQADWVVAHNGDRFDVPRVNARVCEAGLEPLGVVQSIDTLKLVRQSFAWPYNDLNTIAKRLLGKRKVAHDGFATWRDAFRGDDNALRVMEKYNKGDVVLLEDVFEAIRPYVKSLPALWEAAWGGQMACPFCGSYRLIQRGHRRTKASVYTQYQCKDCNRYTRSRSAMENPKLKTVPS